jgi:catechol 2,3-dioxygenase-like lactoylglutathione lyase family enzyme
MRKAILTAPAVIFIASLASAGVAADSRNGPWVTDIQPPQFFAVLVADVDISVAWYSAVFGLDQVGGSEAEDGAWRIENLQNKDLHVEIIRDDRALPANRPLGFRKVGFRVPAVKKIADSVEQATGERPRVVDDTRFGMQILQLKDPDGNVIQLTSLLEDVQ